MMLPNLQPLMITPVLAPFRRALRRSSWLRKVYDRCRTDESVLETRHIPEAAFSDALKTEIGWLQQKLSKVALGDYLEFGVFNGVSLACAHHAFNECGADHVRFLGFDSFEGLPKQATEDDDGVWFPGQFACRIDLTETLLNKRGVDWRRVSLVKGWFDDTLNDETIQSYGIGPVSVVMIDCDLYSSTVACLEFVAPLLTDHAVLIFDDWNAHELAEKQLGERKAFEEFIATSPAYRAEEVKGYHSLSRIMRLERRREDAFVFRDTSTPADQEKTLGVNREGGAIAHA